jgi:hypothetical protein
MYLSIIPVMVRSLKQKNHGSGWPGQKSKTLSLNNQKEKKGTEDVAQAVENLLSKLKP